MDFGEDDDATFQTKRTKKTNNYANDNFLDIQTEPQIVDPDEEFEGECCFWLMKLLRGHNVGRRLKRKVFKYALMNFMVGFSMLVITVYEGETKV